MSLITTAINLIGGSIIGIVQSGDSIGNVLSTYSIATVGDGLVSQIPALLISVATGMIVTRAVSEGSLNEDVSHQFMAQPHAIMISGLAVAVMSVIPGMPIGSMLAIAVVLVGGGYYLARRIQTEPSIAAAAIYGMEPAIQGEAGAEAAATSAPVGKKIILRM